MSEKVTPRGFWRYARGDDAHLDQRLTTLRKRIARLYAIEGGVRGQPSDILAGVMDCGAGLFRSPPAPKPPAPSPQRPVARMRAREQPSAHALA